MTFFTFAYELILSGRPDGATPVWFVVPSNWGPERVKRLAIISLSSSLRTFRAERLDTKHCNDLFGRKMIDLVFENFFGPDLLLLKSF